MSNQQFVTRMSRNGRTVHVGDTVVTVAGHDALVVGVDGNDVNVEYVGTTQRAWTYASWLTVNTDVPNTRGIHVSIPR